MARADEVIHELTGLHTQIATRIATEPTGVVHGYNPVLGATVTPDGRLRYVGGLSAAIVWETDGGLTIGSGSNVGITLDPTNTGYTNYYIDTSSYWAIGTNGRLVLPADGYYSIVGHLVWNGNATGMVLAALNHVDAAGINIAGLTSTQMASFSSFGGPHMDVTFPLLRAAAGEGVELVARQNSGVSRNTTGDSYLSVMRIG